VHKRKPIEALRRPIGFAWARKDTSSEFRLFFRSGHPWRVGCDGQNSTSHATSNHQKHSGIRIISIKKHRATTSINNPNMKFAAALIALFGSAAAFAPSSASKKSSALAFSVDTIPGALAPVGLFDPLGFAEKADEATLKRYREAELTHGRVAMLAVSIPNMNGR
jgi:Chlorophyll A-B binding protein